MNILFLTQILPYPPDAGPKVKTWNVMRYLLQCGHHITLVSFVRTEEEIHIPVLKNTCNKVYTVPIRRSRIADVFYMLRSYFTGRPFLVERDDLPSMQKLVNKLVQDGEYDLIHADQLTMVQFALRGASSLQNKPPRVVFDAHNAVWTIVKRMQINARWYLKPLLGVEARRVRRYEGKLLKMVDHVLAVTDVDRDGLEETLIQSGGSNSGWVAPITVIPIAIDTQKIQPVRRMPNSNNIVTLGTLHYPPNADGIRWFINEVFPLIRQRVPDSTLTIIGKNPPQDFLAIEAENPSVIKVTGFVPDLTPYLMESALMVVPVRAGGGMRVRILEAFAYAMPIVTTTIGLEGIQATHEKDVLVSDNTIDYANTTIRLLENKFLQDKLSKNGRKLAEKKYDWQVVLKQMDEVYR
jgi:glycosyltransferase involved in cell wall biosynthesis